MRLMPVSSGLTWRARKSFQAPWSIATLAWVDGVQNSHSSAFGAASAASEKAISAASAAIRMVLASSVPLRPGRWQMILEPADQVGRDLVAAGVVEQLVARARIDLDRDVAQPDLVVVAF